MWCWAIGGWVDMADELMDEQISEPRPLPGEPLMPFAAFKTYLPQPLLPDSSGLALYWRAWELIWASINRPTPQNQFVADYAATAGVPTLSMWEATTLTQAGVYGRRAFDFMGGLSNFYAKQHADGFICREIDRETGGDRWTPFHPNSSGPNVLAGAEWRYFRLSGDDGRIGQIFQPLLALHQWCRDNRTWPDGTYWATGISSQLDNQPRVPDSYNHHRHWSWVDATVQAARNCTCLAQMAAQLGQDEVAAQLKEEHARLVALINGRFWNEEWQFYQDVAPDGRLSRVKSLVAYWALLDGAIVPKKRLDAFIQPLREAWAFNLPHRMPTLSADSEGYNADTGNRWRGGVWPCLNFIVLRGLRHVGQAQLAHQIALNHLQNMYQVYMDTGYLWEYYAPETAVPGAGARKNSLNACITPIAALLEDVVGIQVDWPHRRVYWNRQLQTDQPYGVLRYPLGQSGLLDMVGDHQQLTITTDVPFTLLMRDAQQSLQTAVGAGTTQIDLV